MYNYVAVRDQRVLCPCNESWFTIVDLEGEASKLDADEPINDNRIEYTTDLV